MYSFPVVRNAQQRRLDILASNLNDWKRDMTELIRRKYRNKTGDSAVFRWHDSGDLQSLEHFEAIIQIARDFPTIRFWIPTKEIGIVRKWIRRNREFPTNLAVRVSAPMIGSAAKPIPGALSSTVGAGVGYACPAYGQGGTCGPCRACWDTSVPSVDYPQH
jgi:hypothetical protein